MASTYKHNGTTVFLLNYHFVFCPKRRRKVLVGLLRVRLIELLKLKTQELGWTVITLEVRPDRVHLFIGVDPDVSPTQVMHRLKSFTSRVLREEFPQVLNLPSLWTRSYFVSTAGNVSSQKIEHYIQSQSTRA